MGVIAIDREAREIMYLVASVCPSALDIKGSALLSTTKRKEESLSVQSVYLCRSAFNFDIVCACMHVSVCVCLALIAKRTDIQRH